MLIDDITEKAKKSLPSRERGLKLSGLRKLWRRTGSLPSRERGLKWCRNVPVAGDGRVAPFAGAWIEIVVQQGMERISRVAPFAGAWIEMSFGRKVIQDALVAPFAGAWIEMVLTAGKTITFAKSLPSRERGLKFFTEYMLCTLKVVAPFAGAWIEI